MTQSTTEICQNACVDINNNCANNCKTCNNEVIDKTEGNTTGGVVKNINRVHYFSHLIGGLKSVVHSRFFSKRPRPFSLSHMVTNRCNSDCPFCFWKYHARDDELTLEEIKRLYKEAKREGFMTSILWGGEPLLRDDFPEICKASKDNGMYTKVATNGYFIEERPDYAKYSDLTFISLDAIGKKHDEIRRTPNLFDKIHDGIVYLKKHYPKMRIYTCHCISVESDGRIKEIANFAKEMGVFNYFVVNKSNQDFEEWEGKNEVKKYEKTDEQLAEDFKLIKDLKAQGYPIRNSEYFMDYMISKKNQYTCHWPKITMVVYSDGKILRCSDRKPIADLRQQSLRNIIRSSEYRNVAENSDHCKLACVGNYSIDSSGLWNLEWQAIKSIIDFAIT